MDHEDQMEAPSFRAPAAQPGPQKSGVRNRSSSAYNLPSVVNACASHTSSSGALGALPADRSAPFPANSWSYAAVNGAQRQAGPISTDKAPPLCECSKHSSQAPTCGHHHAGGKRPWTLAFSGDAASTQTEPSQPAQLRRLMSLTSHSRQGTTEEGHYRCHAPPAVREARQAGSQAPQLSEADHRTRAELRQGAFVQQLVGATHGLGSDARGRCPSNAAPAAHASTSMVVGGLASDGGHQLASLLSANSPSVLEQLLATAGAAFAPTQGSQGAAATISSFTMSGLAGSQRRDSHPKDAQLAQDERPRAAEPDPHRRPTRQASGSIAPAGLRVDINAAASALMRKRSDGSASGGTSLAGTMTGRASGGCGSEAVPVDSGNGPDGDGYVRRGGAFARDKPLGSAAQVVCGGARAREGGEEAAAAGVPAGARAGSAVPASRSGETKCNEAGARNSAEEQARTGQALTQGRMSADAPMAAAGPGAAVPMLAPPEQQQQQQQPTETVTAQLGAALPPEVAERLKKPIRIIQPISQAWVEETLQGAGGAASSAAAPSVSMGPAASARVPAVASASLPQAPRHEADPRQQSQCLIADGVTAPVPSRIPGSCFRFAGGGGKGAVTAAAAAATTASESPCELSLRDMSVRIAKAAPAALAAPAGSSVSKQMAPPAGRAAAPDLSSLAALAPALAGLASLPPSDTASPIARALLGIMPPAACDAGPAGSGAPMPVAAMPPNSGGNTYMKSAVPTRAAASPFSSGVLPPASYSGNLRPGASCDATAAAILGGGTAAATAALAPEPKALTAASPAVAALLAAGVAPVAAAAAHGAARSPPDPLNCSRGGATGRLAPPLPLQVRQLQAQPVASTGGSTTASCLGKVQGELTLLYQWYVANKAVYLNQAQRQLQRIEALTAACDGAAAASGGSAADAAAAAFARAESAEAMRAFETALKIMSVCGRVEQQWLAGPVMAAAAGGSAAAAAADMGRGLAPEHPAQARGGSAGLQLPANVPAPSSGWAHGASAALAVAAALVGSVGRGQCPAPGPGGPAPQDGPAEAAGAGAAGRAPGQRGVSPTSVVGVAPLAFNAASARPAAGMPLPLAMQGLQAATGAADTRPAVGDAITAPPPSLAQRATTAALPPVVAPISPVTAA